MKTRYDPLLTVMLITAVAIVGCAPLPTAIEPGQPQRIKFKTAGRIPVIEVLLNGKPASFIIDTGASVSVLNESEAERYCIDVIDPFYTSHVEVIGFGGISSMKHTGRCVLEIGTIRITHLRFRSQNLSQLTSAFYAGEQIRIAGVLGADLLTQYRINIDFMNKTISF